MNTKNNRPILDIPLSPTDKMLEIISALGIAFLIIIAVHFWPLLPEKIPSHFGFSGKPDAWGSKGTILLYPIFGAILYATLTLACRFPQTFNYSVQITAENAERQYKIALSIMRWLKMETVLILAYLEWKTIQVGLGNASGLGTTAIWTVLIVMFATLAIQLTRAYKAR